MLHWFGRNFEDPANETPYNSQEGGYLYIWGGPYDAREELGDEFEGLVPDDLIDEVVDEVQRDGTFDWAPGPGHPDHQRRQEEWDEEHLDAEAPDREPDLDAIIGELEAGARPNYGDPAEIEQRQQAINHVDALLQALTQPPPRHGGLGHNNPPADDAPNVTIVAEMRESAGEITGQLSQPRPDALAVAHATSRLKAALNWLGAKANIAADAFAKGFGGAAGNAAGLAVVGLTAAEIVKPGLLTLLHDAVRSVTNWLAHVTFPF
jgi:hypothetical protein